MAVRRSTRTRTVTSYAESSDSEGEHHIDELLADEEINLQHQSPSKGISSTPEHSDTSDVEYTIPSSRKRTGSKRSSHGSKKRKNTLKSASSIKQAQDEFLSIQQEFETSELFKILGSSRNISIEEVASDWIDAYEENRSIALSRLVNLVLDCAGALVHIGEHDVTNNESSNETIGEIQIMFQNQKFHEFHFWLSKTGNKRCKCIPLYQNYVDFIYSIAAISNDRGLIYKESTAENNDDMVIETSALFLDLLTWFPSMSVSKIRALRYISSISIYTLQDFFANIAMDLDVNVLFKLRKQFTMEQRKKRPNQKTLTTLEANINEAHATKSVVESNMDNIIKLCFVHRFKDVDENIRVETITHLSIWMQSYPEFFFKVTFLKYFGWLLSDRSNQVRLQVLKTLLELIRFCNKRNKSLVDNAALRQFYERFKDRLIEIAFKDIDLQVRLVAVQILSVVNSFGYLDDMEILEITSLIFYDHEVKVSSSSRDVKFLNEVAKFFANIVFEKKTEFIERFNGQISLSIPGVTVDQLIETGILMRLLNSSMSKYLATGYHRLDNHIPLLFQASQFLHNHFIGLVPTICRILSFQEDFLSSIPDICYKTSDSAGDTISVSLLLPNVDSDTMFYTTALGGICAGSAVVKKVQEKVSICDLILPEMKSLFTKLNLDSDMIYKQLLDMLCLFQPEDWDKTGKGDDLLSTNEIILRRFKTSSISLAQDNMLTMSYKKLIPHLALSGKPEITSSWKTLLNDILTTLNKFLEESNVLESNEILTLYLQYLNKLVLFGIHFPLEISNDTLDFLLSKFIAKIPEVINSLNTNALLVVDFKFFTSIVAWNLNVWMDIINENKTSVQVSHAVLNQNMNILNNLTILALKLQTNCDISNQRKRHTINCILSAILDITTAIKMFEINLPEKANNWKLAMKQDYYVSFDDGLSSLCHANFLYLEACSANMTGVSLARVGNEDVNFSDAKILGENSDAEKELCIFLMKLKALERLGILENNDLEKRLALNKDLLGPLYNSILDGSAFDGESKKNDSEKTRQVGTYLEPTNNFEGEPLEPIEEFTQDELVISSQRSLDPIEYSEL